MTVTIEEIRRAAALIGDAVVPTPCLHSRVLTASTGAEVYIKLENLQFTSSFKDRGALVKLLSLSEHEKDAGVIAMSAGNHAQGVAYHAQRLGIPATIVMPIGTPNVKVSRTKALGARVRIQGAGLTEATAFAETLCAEEGLTFIHPYDDEPIIAGQGTIALEMLEDVPGLECLVIPIGGGGLIAGNSVAAKALKPDIEIVGTETELYPSMYHALRGEEAVCGGQSLAEGIAVKEPGERTTPIIKENVDDILLVSETDIERAVTMLLELEKTVVEGAGAAGLAALLAFPSRFAGRRVGLILCGGNIDTRLLASLLLRALFRDGRIARFRVETADQPGALADVARIIGEIQGNIIEIAHQRTFLDVPAKLADLDIVLETRDREHIQEILHGLREAGYRVRLLTEAAASN